MRAFFASGQIGMFLNVGWQVSTNSIRYFVIVDIVDIISAWDITDSPLGIVPRRVYEVCSSVGGFFVWSAG